MPNTWFSVFFVTCALLLSTALAYAPVDEGYGRNLYDLIYTDLLDEYPCVRLVRGGVGDTNDGGTKEKASTAHAVGCGSPRGGVKGRVVSALTSDEVDSLMEKSPSGDWIAYMSGSTFTLANMNDLSRKSKGLVGVVVSPGNAPFTGFSPASGSLIFDPPKTSSQPLFLNGMDKNDNNNNNNNINGNNNDNGMNGNDAKMVGIAAATDHVWNTQGSAMRYVNFAFPIWLLSKEGDAVMSKAAVYNSDSEGYPRYTAELNSFMHASRTGDVRECLLHDPPRCDPLSGQSVLASVAPKENKSNVNRESITRSQNKKGDRVGPLEINPNATTVLVTTKIDATAMFQDAAEGAESSLSGTVALAAAMRGLSVLVANITTVSYPFERNIVAALLNGEAYEGIGSRRLARDISDHSRCDSEVARESDASCSLDFSKFAAIIDIGAVGLNSSSTGGPLYARAAGSDMKSSHALRTVMENAAASYPGAIDVAAATPVIDVQTNAKSFENDNNSNNDRNEYDRNDNDNDRKDIVLDSDAAVLAHIPPSPASSFLAFNSSIPSLRLTDWDSHLISRYDDSRFDTLSRIDVDRVCGAAKTIMAALYSIAGPKPGVPLTAESAGGSDAIDCDEIRTVLSCVTKTVDEEPCDLAKSLFGKKGDIPMTHYIGVGTRITHYVGFLERWLDAANGDRLNSTFHIAYPSDMYVEKNLYVVADTLHDPIWAESRWDNDVGIRVFMEDSSISEVALLITGIFVSAGTYGFAVFAKRNWLDAMKRM